MEKYDVISVVGEGSYGLVMRCRHRESGQHVAIKKFLETEDDPTVRKMAIREIRMLKKLRHENLVNMIEVFRRKKRFFLVFEYLEHTVLEELEARAGGLGFVTSRKYIYQVLRALDFIHSNSVIHRDIKPENVLVSRLGVIKLCDFGFARPYQENETFTDYVATRWYRSPELLIGDPRYGKEVDIWATGCLYSEMMTGEPLFPGESDVDQLFQIVRVVGKLNARHQMLISRNTVFKGMKQEQSTTLGQLLPDWNRDCLSFLGQCLRMDSATRPDTAKLLKHDLFLRDDFIETFMPELRSKISQELQGNPLLKRMHGVTAAHRKPEERKSSNGSITMPESKSRENSIGKTKEKTAQIGLSLAQILGGQHVHQHQQQPPPQQQPTQIVDKGGPSVSKFPDTGSIRSSQGSDELNLNLAHYKHYLTSQHNLHTLNVKPISVSNLTLAKDVNAQLKYGARILSAKHQRFQLSDKLTQASINADPPPASLPFQSLQHEPVPAAHLTSLMDKTLSQNSPLTVNGSNIPSYFANKRTTNLLGSNLTRPPLNHALTTSSTTTGSHQAVGAPNKYSPLPLGGARLNLAKRDRGLLLDVGHLPYGMVGTTPDSLKTEPSPRVLPPPAWLMSNLKVTTQGKNTHQIGKRGVTDWKTVVCNQTNSGYPPTVGTGAEQHASEAITLPSCPGALSPVKNIKKKLTPMTNHPHVSINHAHEQNYFTTPRHFSASSQKGVEP